MGPRSVVSTKGKCYSSKSLLAQVVGTDDDALGGVKTLCEMWCLPCTEAVFVVNSDEDVTEGVVGTLLLGGENASFMQCPVSAVQKVLVLCHACFPFSQMSPEPWTQD